DGERILLSMTREVRRERRSFDDKFKADVVKMVVELGRSRAAVARDLDLAESSVGRWVAEATGTIGSGSGSHRRAADPDSDDQFEMRKRIAELEEENAFLKKAAAFFAREQR
ncbi:transposase, partial [Gordonia asplenii]